MLSRSLSLSEFPVIERNSTEEHKCNASRQPLIKHYSCEQILYNAEKIRIERIVQEFSISTDISSWKSWEVKYEGSLSSFKKCCENVNAYSPKSDLELFPPVDKKTDKLPGPKTLRPLSLPASSSTEERKNYLLFAFLPIIFVVIAVVACSSVYLASQQRVCEITLDIGALKSVLENSIFGQKDVIYNMVSTLHAFYSTRDPGFVIMTLFGGVGVGKTYTTSIISELFPWKENIQHFILPLHFNSLSVTEVYAKFSSCGDNLVIMDGLVPSESADIIKFLQNLMKHSQDGGVRVIVILVFSNEDQKIMLQGYGDMEHEVEVKKPKLRSIFQDAGLEVSLNTFQALQREHIVMCIKEALSQKGIVWSSTEIEQVMALLPQGTGCKGVASKVQLLIASGAI
jgi:hypothetical protein